MLPKGKKQLALPKNIKSNNKKGDFTKKSPSFIFLNIS